MYNQTSHRETIQNLNKRIELSSMSGLIGGVNQQEATSHPDSSPDDFFQNECFV